ncbi:hypothetical protein L218DRAFT_1071565 [Marasmius fiardii PR-910]|nr:hypothetical protein L218DRAFT_1071565 [Marasmius fiardii PR-910]
MFRTIIKHGAPRAHLHAFDLPPPTSGWPTPWLTPQEVERYLFPLHHSFEWRVSFVSKTQCSRSVPTLQKTFHFGNSHNALEFMKDVLDIADDENHHPATLRYDESPQARVFLGVRTHSAKLPPDLVSYFIEHVRREPPTSLRRQGITLRDIRFALLIDTRYRDQYAVDEKKEEKLPEKDGTSRPSATVDELLKHLLSQVQ